VSQEGIAGSLQTALDWLSQPVVSFSVASRGMALGLLLGVLVLFGLVAWLAVPWARRWWTDETPRPGEDESGVSTKEMTLQEHLLELRNRLVISVIALTVTTGIAFIWNQLWLQIAVAPCPGCKLISTSPTGIIFSVFKVTLVVGIVVAMPVIAYEAWAYIAPGLTRKERRYVIAIIPGATVSFILGILFAYFALLPAALRFLAGFSTSIVDFTPDIDKYLSFITRLLVASGLIFQMPLVMFFLSKVRLINPRMLGSIRRYVIVAAFIVAADVTPTPDPFNPLLVAIPTLVLYEVGALLARLA